VLVSAQGENIMKHFKEIFSNLVNDESGQDLIEYALVACLIALAAVVTMTALGTTISGVFTTIGTKITNAV
jgi:pilus assembly protein Flp/PilA